MGVVLGGSIHILYTMHSRSLCDEFQDRLTACLSSLVYELENQLGYSSKHVSTPRIAIYKLFE